MYNPSAIERVDIAIRRLRGEMDKDAQETADWVMGVMDEADKGSTENFLGTAGRLQLRTLAVQLAEAGAGRRAILRKVLENTFVEGNSGFVNR